MIHARAAFTIFVAFLALLAIAVVDVRADRQFHAIYDELDASAHGHVLRSGPGVRLTGQERRGNFTTLDEDALDFVHVNANTPTVVYTMKPPPPAGRIMQYQGSAILRYDEGDAAVSCDAGVCGAVIRRYLPGEFRGGGFCRPDGVCSGATLPATGIDAPGDAFVPGAGAIMNGAAAQIVWTGTTLGIQVTCPVPCQAAAGISGQTFDDPALTARVVSVAPSTVATVYASALPLTITTSSGAATGAVGATYAGTTLTGCSVTNDHTLTCNLPAGTYAPIVNAPVTVNSPASPLACATCANVAASAVTGIAPASGPLAGGSAVTITLNAGATGGCATPPQLCNNAAAGCVNVTGCLVVNDTTITATSGANGAGNGNVNVTSPSGPSPLVNGYTYANAPTLTAQDPAAGGGFHFAPLLATAAASGAGGIATTLPGTTLSGASVKVCGVAATGVTSTATSVTYTPPAGLPASTTAPCGNVVVTTSGGSFTGAAYWVLPAYAQLNVWYPAAPYITMGTGIASITDAIGGVVVSQATGTKQPTLGAIAAGAAPVTMTFASASAQVLTQGTYTGPIKPGTVSGQIVIGSTATAGVTQVMVDSTSLATLTEIYMSSTDNKVHCTTGGALENISTTLFSGGAMHYASCWNTEASTSLAGVDTGYGTGNFTGSNAQSGITIGSEYNATNFYNGTAVMVIEIGGANVPNSTSGDPAALHTFAQNFAGTP